MNPYLAEFVGTALLVLFGDGVVAGVLLNKSKAQNGGWIVITAGWAFGVAIPVYAIGTISGGHINPAVTIGLAVTGKFAWSQVAGYLGAQFLGALVGAVLVWLAYLAHWEGTAEQSYKLAIFCTGPAIRRPPMNFVTEAIGTFVLMFGVMALSAYKPSEQSGLTPLLVGILVWGIGLSLGGPTGYAINPARDLGPRIAHAILPIAGKGGSDWGYAWVPVVGPLVGGILGAVTYVAMFKG
ncbi:MAG TPA: MIP/aquaporin family protein [Terriglobia bacterium]|nr:MIP/aquaporin family protein [Terriglobia bacterium]